jgi:hypothetical protein
MYLANLVCVCTLKLTDPCTGFSDLQLLARQCIASVVNKAAPALATLIDTELVGALQQRAHASLASFHTYVWVVKGLIMRRHAQTANLIASVATFLKPSNNTNADIATVAASAYDTILQEFDNVLTKDANAIVNVCVVRTSVEHSGGRVGLLIEMVICFCHTT